MVKVAVVILAVVLFLAAVAPSVTAQPWLPDECEGLRWWSPPGQVWDCLMAVMSELFTGWPGYEDPPGEW